MRVFESLPVAVFAAIAVTSPALASPDRLVATAGTVSLGAVATLPLAAKADPMFRSLFDGWTKMDALPAAGSLAVPSETPVRHFRYTSPFGVRVDPFNHSVSMHPGIDMAAPVGTPVYASADGIVSRAERAGGYGNLVQLEHGKGLETRYGHLSRILVHYSQHVRRGDLIALVGSTGRSTGSHLHYEVRIDGRAVNPMPFLQTSDYLMALEDRAPRRDQRVAVGGPEDPAGD